MKINYLKQSIRSALGGKIMDFSNASLNRIFLASALLFGATTSMSVQAAMPAIPAAASEAEVSIWYENLSNKMDGKFNRKVSVYKNWSQVGFYFMNTYTRDYIEETPYSPTVTKYTIHTEVSYTSGVPTTYYEIVKIYYTPRYAPAGAVNGVVTKRYNINPVQTLNDNPWPFTSYTDGEQSDTFSYYYRVNVRY